MLVECMQGSLYSSQQFYSIEVSDFFLQDLLGSFVTLNFIQAIQKRVYLINFY